MDNQLIIPDKLKIGFNKREDTYSGKLAFITYYLKDGTTKHKKAWQNWIEEDIPVIEVDNKPKEGFILNRNEGGGGRWSYDEREAKIRVWDPAGFEFEISIPNMLEILQVCGSYPGKGLEGKFVYAFDGNRLQLLPISSEQYRNSVEFTNLAGLSITKEDLVVGATYKSKSQETLIYMGYHPWIKDSYYSAPEMSVKPEHVFYNGSRKNPGWEMPVRADYGVELTDAEWEKQLAEDLLEMGPEYSESFGAYKITDIAKVLDPTVAPNYAELVDKMQGCGFLFQRKDLKIRKEAMVCRAYKETHWDVHGQYEDQTLWIKKDENTYESVRFLLMFPPGESRRYGSRNAKANGIMIKYGKKLTLTPDGGVAVTKSSKTDKKVYTPAEIEAMEYYSIKLDMTVYVTNEMIRYSYSKKERESNVKKYSLKEIA